MLICGYEKFSMVDYDGKIACTVFTGGCNFRCPFCHNGALVVGNVSKQGDMQEEVFDYLEKRKGLVDAVCVSGGEPTLQPDIKDFLRKVRAMGYSIKLDTNGYRPDVLKEIIEEGLVDYIAMDVKNSPQKYALTTGLKNVNIDDILLSISMVISSKINHEFRTTLIKEFHTEEDMRAIADMIKGAQKYFMQKYKDDDECIRHGFNSIDKQEVEKFKTYFERHVQTIGLRGYN